MQGDDSPDFQFAYAQLEGLCQSIMSELKSDLMLHDTGVFPQPIQVPQITSAEYCKVWDPTDMSRKHAELSS